MSLKRKKLDKTKEDITLSKKDIRKAQFKQIPIDPTQIFNSHIWDQVIT